MTWANYAFVPFYSGWRDVAWRNRTLAFGLQSRHIDGFVAPIIPPRNESGVNAINDIRRDLDALWAAKREDQKVVLSIPLEHRDKWAEIGEYARGGTLLLSDTRFYPELDPRRAGKSSLQPLAIAGHLTRSIERLLPVAEQFGARLALGVMESAFATLGYHYGSNPEQCPAFRMIRESHILNLCLCGYVLCFPLDDARRRVSPTPLWATKPMGLRELIAAEHWNTWPEHPYQFVTDYIRPLNMITGAGGVNNVLAGGIPFFKQGGYAGCTFYMNEDTDWDDTEQKLEEAKETDDG